MESAIRNPDIVEVSQLITRIVLLKLHESVMEPAALSALIDASYDQLEKVPGVRRVQLSTAADTASSASWDLCLMIYFDRIEDVGVYQTHPKHVAYVEEVLAPATAFKKAWNFDEKSTSGG